MNIRELIEAKRLHEKLEQLEKVQAELQTPNGGLTISVNKTGVSFYFNNERDLVFSHGHAKRVINNLINEGKGILRDKYGVTR